MAFLTYINNINRRIEEETRSPVDHPRSRANNAVISLATLVLSVESERAEGGAQIEFPSVEDLITEWSGVYNAMTSAGPDIAWQKGGIVELYLIIMKTMGWSVENLVT